MDVGGWLRNLGLDKYEAAFRENGIDEQVLRHVTAEDLREIGVATVGDRRKLLAAIADLAAPTPLTEPRPPPGASVQPKIPEVSAERRPITVMFCDLVGSTSLASRLDPEDWRNLVNAYLDEASKAVTGVDGHVLKRLGDGLMALFGYPQAQENDAERAVRAGLAIQRALAEINARNAGEGAPKLTARIGIESGPVVMETTGEVFGDAPNVAARVQAAAEPGSVLVTMNVHRQVAGLFVAEEQAARELKGVADPVSLYRIVRASGAGRRIAGRALTPFVGREEELGLLMRRWERACSGEGQLVLIVGEPGLGKSRIIEEFCARLARTPHTWVEWSASQLLQNTPLHPFAEWGRQRFGGADVSAEQRLADLENTLRQVKIDADEAAPLLAPLLDIPLPRGRVATFAPEELRRRQLSAVVGWIMAGARTQPIVLAFEDLQWADPTSIDVLRALAESGAQAPILIIATGRPEFRPRWSMRSHHSAVSLAPLNPSQVRKMVGEIASRHALSKDLVDGVSERTGGVPLFVEEVTRLLLENDEPGGARAIPLTLQQSLAARLDRLGVAREIAQVGAVIGRDFTYALLREVAEKDEAELRAGLERLAEADILFVDGLLPKASYRFKHALIQDAAYHSLLKASRKLRHRRVAEALEEKFPETAETQPELLALHYTEAGLNETAIDYWRKAGERAAKRAANIEAVDHLRRGLALLEALPDRSAHADKELALLVGLGPALMSTRTSAAPEIQEIYARARELARDADKAAELFMTLWGLSTIAISRGNHEVARACAAELFSIAHKQNDVGYLLQAHHAAWAAEQPIGNLKAAHKHIEAALRLYDKDAHRDHAVLYGGHDPGTCAYITDARVLQVGGELDQALVQLEKGLALARELEHPPTLVHTLGFATEACFVFRDPVKSLTLVDEWLPLAMKFGSALGVANATMLRGWANVMIGEIKAGLAEMRDGLDQWRSMGSKFYAPTRLGRAAATFLAAGEVGQGAAVLAEAFEAIQSSGEHWYEAELHRLQGLTFAESSPARLAEAEACFGTAMDIARSQGARLFELRAAMALNRLPCDREERKRRKAVLSSILGAFTEGFAKPDLKEAGALLAEISA